MEFLDKKKTHPKCILYEMIMIGLLFTSLGSEVYILDKLKSEKYWSIIDPHIMSIHSNRCYIIMENNNSMINR